MTNALNNQGKEVICVVHRFTQYKTGAEQNTSSFLIDSFTYNYINTVVYKYISNAADNKAS